ncbi:MAG TPA: YebC/PmpR family DNA-binding transcriptional regulator, partial [Woeseiaceae bacterium]|nr:YebC/PmpR family DNA-binding transcriptional regulator [Woeseiaceae bacterium]
KWANIQHRKGAQDKKRGKLFSKLIREITIASKLGGSDLDANPRLRLAVDKAKSQSMPKDNIARAIKRGAGELDSVDYQEIRYEGYGPGGAAVIVDCLTDNKNRTVSEVRHTFSKYSGNLGSDGSVAYLFESLGVLSYFAVQDENELMEAAIDGGADDVLSQMDDLTELVVDPANYENLIEYMKKKGFEPNESEITMRSSTVANLNESEALTMIKLTEALEDLDDVQTVYSNAEIADDILENI